jgi:DNA polymerase-1
MTMTESESADSHSSNNDNTLFLVDGSSYIYRAFYGIRNSLTTADGLPTNAVYGFTQMLKTLLHEYDPEYVAVAFDAFEADEPNFRKEMFDDYKAHRSEMPEDLKVQLPYLHRVVEGLHIPILKSPKVEADDLIATAARRAQAEDLEVCIISGDKDLMQLLGDGIRMHDTMRDRTFSPDDAEEKFGVPPDQVRYVMAMSGDSSDNIPGVPGIGPKTGGKLIRKFGDLDGVYDNLDKVGGKKRPKSLKEHEQQARMSLELVTLKEDCDLEVGLDELRLTRPDIRKLNDLFDELEFESIRDDIREWLDARGWLDDEEQLALSLGPASYGATGRDRPDKSYTGIFEMDALDDALESCRQADAFGFDLETTSVDPLDAEIVGLSFAWKPDHAVYVPVGHTGSDADEHDQLDRDEVLERAAPLLESDAHQKVLQHWKYEWIVLQNYDIELTGIAWDTMLMSYLIDPGKNSHNLDTLVREQLDYDPISYEDVAGSGASQVSFDQVPIEEAIPYAAEDADVTLKLSEVLADELDEQLTGLHHELEVPLARILGVMERKGIRVDREILDDLNEEFTAELESIKQKIDEHAGREVNPNSPKQLREVLFEDLGLPVKKRTKTGPSTDREVLEQLSDEHPLPDLILEYRSFSKLKGTYVDALPDLIRDDGRIHTSFNQAVAATGRLSSSDPNLQNIPVRTNRGRRIRKAFVPEDDWTLCVADYSQIELRILAHMSGDPLLVEAYRDGDDVHRLTASQVFEVEPDEVSKEQRELGKTVNYGVLYGMGPSRLARDFDIERSRASDYIDRFFERYEVVDQFFSALLDKAYERGFVETLFGRRRRLPGLEGHGGQQAYAERAAINAPIQGTAADIIKVAMIELQNEIDQQDRPVRQLLQVHDELVFEVRDDVVDDAVAFIRDHMEGVIELSVPLTVDIGTGPNWLDAK